MVIAKPSNLTMRPSVQVNRLFSKLDQRLSLNQRHDSSSESLVDAVNIKLSLQASTEMKRTGSAPKISPKAINDHIGKQASTASRRLPRRQSMPLMNHAPPQPVKKAPANNPPSRRVPRRQSMPLLNQTPPQPVKKASANRTLRQDASIAPYTSSIFPKHVPKNLEALMEAFPGAIPITQLVGHVTATLAHHDYGNSTLLATSLCCDEVNRDLEREFEEHYGDHFSMGGLAGFPFGGVTSFNAMAHHIPDDGSCLLVYGPHVGIDRAGNIGTVERRGRLKSGACCGSANAAASYVCVVHNGSQEKDLDLSQGMDIEQHFVGQMLLPHAKRLEKAKNMKVEVPHICYEECNKGIHKIVEQCCGEVAGSGKIALLGGIQINTPFEQEDYFLPFDFEIQTNTGTVIDKFEEAFVDGAEIMA